MKLTKKILLAATALLAASMVFTGCAEEEGETGKIGKDFELKNTNPTQYLRGWSTTKTKHTSATAKITFYAQDTYGAGDATSGGTGVIGFIFGLNDVVDSNNKETGEKDFGIIGLRRESASKIGYYVSMFESVYPEEDFLNRSNNFQKKDGTDAIEHAIDPTSGVTSQLFDDNSIKATDDIKVWVVLEATGTDTNSDGKVGDGEGDGGYKVTFYKNTTDAKGKDIKGGQIKEVTIPTAKTKDAKATQHKLGLYTNVYGGTTEEPNVLKGRLDLSDAVNGVEVEITD